jgi:alginate O-acetyltransferase complex protein AlgI
MSFTNPLFLFVFLPIAILTYWNVRSVYRSHVILISSLMFIALLSIYDLTLLLITIFVNWIFICKFTTERNNNKALIVPILWNISFLGLFKYYHFITDNINPILPKDLPNISLILPVGISYYTFVLLAYLIDFYKENLITKPKFIDFVNYISFFPKFISGPITKSDSFGNQLHEKAEIIKPGYAAAGLSLIIIGLSKKILIADVIARNINTSLWLQCESLDFWGAWIAALGYTLQLYFDFSGYSDMAVGIGRLFGFELPINFNAPYQSLNFRDFWRRWHISLSDWLKRYLYISLGGSARSTLRTYFNIFVTMVICGLWHGASWTFVIWGSLHGVMLIFYRIAHRWWDAIPSITARVIMLPLIVMSWVYFRAPSVTEGNAVFKAMFGVAGFDSPATFDYQPDFIIAMAAGIIYTQFFKDTKDLNFTFNSKWIFLLVTMGVFSVLMMDADAEFLYLRF